jgi:hypothetical protein
MKENLFFHVLWMQPLNFRFNNRKKVIGCIFIFIVAIPDKEKPSFNWVFRMITLYNLIN